MKPFNLEEALAGKPVVTRDGRKVTHLAYNSECKKEYNSLSGWINNDRVCTWRPNGRFNIEANITGDSDLFMAEEENNEAKEEAKRLISQFFAIAPQPYIEKEVGGLKFEEWDKYWTLNFAKEAALITVKEILSFMRKNDIENQYTYWVNHKKYEFYLDVKIEIIKYK